MNRRVCVVPGAAVLALALAASAGETVTFKLVFVNAQSTGRKKVGEGLKFLEKKLSMVPGVDTFTLIGKTEVRGAADGKPVRFSTEFGYLGTVSAAKDEKGRYVLKVKLRCPDGKELGVTFKTKPSAANLLVKPLSAGKTLVVATIVTE